MADKKLEIVIEAKDNASKTISGLESSVSKTFGTLGSMAKTATIALAAVGAGAIAFGISSVKAFADAEASQKRFETGMKNIAGASDEQIAALRRQQMALQATTRFEDDAIASGQGFLATFQMSAQQIEYLTPKLLDMAEGMRDSTGASIGLEQASNMLGKAVQLGTVGMLAKAGVTIPGTTKAMQDLFKKNFELANIQERVRMVGELVEGNFKGQAVAAGTTLAGKIDILNNQWGNFKENVGQLLAQYLVPLLTKLVEFSDKLQNLNIPDTIAAGWQTLRSTIQGFFSDTSVVWNFLKDLFGPTLLSIKNTAMDAFTTMRNALAPIMPELTVMAQFFGVVLLGALWAFGRIIAEVFKIAVNVVVGFVEIFSGIVQTLRGIMDILVAVFTGNWKAVGDGFKTLWNGLVTFLSGVARVIFSPFASSLENLKQGFKDAMNAIVNLWNSTIGGKGFKVPSWVPEFGGKEYKFPTFQNRATGGPVMGGRAYMVGERGPEMFVPSSSGSINNQVQNQTSQSVVHNWNFSGANIVDKEAFMSEIKRSIGRDQELNMMGAY